MQGASRGTAPPAKEVETNAPTLAAPDRLPRAFRNVKFLVGNTLFLLIASALILWPIVFATDPTKMSLTSRLIPPGVTEGQLHLMGTDQLGRDIFARVVEGGRQSLTVSITAVVLAVGVGLVLGLLAGFYGGRADTFIMRLADVQLAFPFILLALLLVAVLGTGLLNLVIILSLSSWVIYARTVRGEVLAMRERDFVTALRVIGARDTQIIFAHLLPNVFPLIVVISTIQVGAMIIIESSLSFLGVGLQPPAPSWGRDLFEGRRFMESAWWVGMFPGLAILLTVISVNLIGEGLRESMSRRA